MLSEKFDKYEIMKDQFLAEMVFKFDKNITHLATYDKKGRDILHSITFLINETDNIADDMLQINNMYKQLDEISSKIEKLSQNQSFIHENMVKQMNSKESVKFKHLQETWTLMTQIDKINTEFTQDCNNKIRIIREVVPDLVFGVENVEKLNLVMDVWTYHNNIDIK